SFPLLSLSNFRFISGFKRDKTKYYFGPYKEKDIVKSGDIIIAATDVTQDRKLLGSPAFVPNLNNEMIFSLDVFRVSKSKLPKTLLYYLLQTPEYRQRVEGFATGTTVTRVKDDVILGTEVVLPKNNKVTKEFDDIISKYFNLISQLENQNENLSNLRDTLLPKLLAGEIELPDDMEVTDDVPIS